MHSIIRVATFNTSHILLYKIVVTHKGRAHSYLKHGLVKPPRELNSYQKVNQFRQQFILPEELVKCDPINGYTLKYIQQNHTMLSL